jgi:glycosyltransferase involved in cell wall biosynthesis
MTVNATLEPVASLEGKSETGITPKEKKTAYLMSAFPALTETFVLFEILAMNDLGVRVELFPLRRLSEAMVHPEVERLRDCVHYPRIVSWEMMRSQFHFIRRRPWTYFRTLWEVVSGTFGSRKFFLKSCAAFPIAVHFAYQMQRQGIPHVHAHFANHPTLAALVINRLTGIPFSFTAHGSDLHVDRRMLDKKVRAAEFVVTVSEFNKRVILDECGKDVADKVKIIHCGIDCDVFRIRRKHAAEGRLQILCIAALKDVKGHKYLVEALRILRQRKIDFVCHLVGEGPERAAIEAQVNKCNLENHVLLHGARTRSEILEMLATSDIAVLTSVPTREGKREGIPVALMEAMASGLPVVASRLSGIPELVDDEESGLLVPPEDTKGLAVALERLSGDLELRIRMGLAGQAKVFSEFNLRNSTLQRATLYAREK